MSRVVRLLDDRSLHGRRPGGRGPPPPRCPPAPPPRRRPLGHRGPSSSPSAEECPDPTAPLSSAVAWNRRRVQNMILVVGPGTPATVLSREVNSDDEPDDDDDDEEEEEGGAGEEEEEEEEADEDYGEEEGEDGPGGDSDDDEGVDDVVDNGENRVRLGERSGLATSERGDNDSSSNGGRNDEGDGGEAGRGPDEGADERDPAGGRHRPRGAPDGHHRHHDEPDGRHRHRVAPSSSLPSGGRPMPPAALFPFPRDAYHRFRSQWRRGSSSAPASASDAAAAAFRGVGWSRPPWICPSMRHCECGSVRTAGWLTAPWRFAAAAGASSSTPVVGAGLAAIGSRECPTQIITSGDDRIVKVWDVSGAMGTDAVSAGGWNTRLPFGRNHLDPAEEGPGGGGGSRGNGWRDRWRDNARMDVLPHGMVVNVAAVSTEHRGSVLHASALRFDPGRVLTCGADGQLRRCDLVAEASAAVVLPRGAADGDAQEGGSSAPSPDGADTAFYHLSLTAHTGLLCSKRGLHLFDLRLAPRDQPRASILNMSELAGSEPAISGPNSSFCIACAAWNPHASSSKEEDCSSEVESHYVFAGGNAATVGLFDVRSVSSSPARSRVVQLYAPRGVPRRGSDVSVSGLDVSKGGGELLVSYRFDQIYAFPVAHNSLSSGNPTTDDLDAVSEAFSSTSCEPKAELFSYGGHLNRFSTLSRARYAGPNDEYIVTGCDNGYAWIYEREDGAVVSLLGADSDLCSGIVPHPTLPFFVTYGNDSTAKLWRATPPVDPKSDDSTAARAARAGEIYKMSEVTKDWTRIQAVLGLLEEPGLLPDNIPKSLFNDRTTGSRRLLTVPPGQIPHYGNALEKLPSVLRQNLFDCYKTLHSESPTVSDIVAFRYRVCVSQLRHQANQRGLAFDARAPWALRPQEASQASCPADLVPDFPSDWVYFDPKMRPNAPLYRPRESFQEGSEPEDVASLMSNMLISEDPAGLTSVPWLPLLNVPRPNDATGNAGCNVARQSGNAMRRAVVPIPYSDEDVNSSRRLLYETVLLLKEGGNEAMKAGSLHAAATRYDKAIQYCAVAYMLYSEGCESLKRFTHGLRDRMGEDGTRKAAPVITAWTPLLEVLVACRMNLSLLLLRPPFRDPETAIEQGQDAVRLLLPFGVHPGKVVQMPGRGDVVLRSNEPLSTCRAAQALLQKAYYRCGSAELEAGKYSCAVMMFEQSLRVAWTPHPLTLKRLEEAKRLEEQSRAQRSRES